jgi:hypothetical protein
VTLEWRTDDTWGDTRYTARNDLEGGWLGSYEISPSEKYGGFNVEGLLERNRGGGTGWAKTLEEAKAVAEDDYSRRARRKAWFEYIETHDPPSDAAGEQQQGEQQ